MIEIDGEEKDVLKEDWDLLIILDGCMFDVFKRYYLPYIKKKSTLHKARTGCKGTKEYFEKNFIGEDCSDIILVSPIIVFDKWFPNNNFFFIDKTWDDWNYDYGTVMPDVTNQRALNLMRIWSD